MVFANLGPREKEAFFGLLDELSLTNNPLSPNESNSHHDAGTSSLALICYRLQGGHQGELAVREGMQPLLFIGL